MLVERAILTGFFDNAKLTDETTPDCGLPETRTTSIRPASHGIHRAVRCGCIRQKYRQTPEAGSAAAPPRTSGMPPCPASCSPYWPVPARARLVGQSTGCVAARRCPTRPRVSMHCDGRMLQIVQDLGACNLQLCCGTKQVGIPSGWLNKKSGVAGINLQELPSRVLH